MPEQLTIKIDQKVLEDLKKVAESNDMSLDETAELAIAYYVDMQKSLDEILSRRQAI